MREIIQIQIGNKGIQVGNEFWKLICNEHFNFNFNFFNTPSEKKTEENKDQSTYKMENISIFYNEDPGSKYIPRSIFVDLEGKNSILLNGINFNFNNSPDPTDLSNSNLNLNLNYRPENLISQNLENQSFSPKSINSDVQKYIDTILDRVRKESEMCNNLQGFQIVCPVGGDLGLGLESTLEMLLQESIKNEFPNNIIANYSIFSSSKLYELYKKPDEIPHINNINNIYKFYNLILALNHLIDQSEEVFLFDSGEYDSKLKLKLNSLQKIENSSSNNLININSINSLHRYKIISSLMSNITCNFRFRNNFNYDLPRLALNLIPFPRMHFLHSEFLSNSNYNFYVNGSENSNFQKNPSIELIEEKSITTMEYFYKLLTDYSNSMAISSQNQTKKQIQKQYSLASLILRGDNFTNLDFYPTIKKAFNDNTKLKTIFCNSQNSQNSQNLNYNSNNVKLGGTSNSYGILGNSSVIIPILDKVYSEFNSHLSKHSFFNSNLNSNSLEGIEEEDILQSACNIKDLISEYENSYNELQKPSKILIK